MFGTQTLAAWSTVPAESSTLQNRHVCEKHIEQDKYKDREREKEWRTAVGCWSACCAQLVVDRAAILLL